MHAIVQQSEISTTELWNELGSVGQLHGSHVKCMTQRSRTDRSVENLIVCREILFSRFCELSTEVVDGVSQTVQEIKIGLLGQKLA